MPFDSPPAVAQRASLARAGLRAFLNMLVRHNFVHADLHPGNILVDLPPLSAAVPAAAPAATPAVEPAAEPAAEARLSFVDAGLVVRLSKRDQRNFLQLLYAIGAGDGARAAELMLRRAPHQQCADPAAFREGMARLVKAARVDFCLRELRIGQVLLEVSALVREHRVAVDGAFTSLVMSIAVLEGLGRQLDPTLDLFSVAMPLLRALPAHVLADDADELPGS